MENLHQNRKPSELLKTIENERGVLSSMLDFRFVC